MSDLKNISSSQYRSVFNDFLLENFDDPALAEKFDVLTELYFEVNSVINISAIRDVDDVYVKHYLDSLYPYKYFSGSCCDVGCGGGFPCLPLAIATKLDFTGVESVGKKLKLITLATERLGLKNITANHVRAEDLAKCGKRFDTVCARAVSNADTALSYCAPLAKRDGKIILYKTPTDSAATIKTEQKQGVTLLETVDYLLPKTDISRRLLVYVKH